MTKIIRITNDLREKYNSQLLSFENNFTYPFADDSFTINHGKNYFRFFDLLGKPYILIATDRNKIIGVAVIVLRNIDIANTKKLEPVWYICDLKIHPNYRAKGIVQNIFDFAINNYSTISTKIYGISMNSNFMKTNRLIHLARRLPNINLVQQETLIFYMLKKNQLDQINNLLWSRHIKFGYLSLFGVKDLIMSSTKKPMKLIHIVPENRANITISNIDDYYYMFCLASSNPLAKKLELSGITPASTASVISNITNCDWNFILTSEI